MVNPIRKTKNRKIFASVFMSYSAVVVLVLMLACFFTFNLVRNYVFDWHREELLKQADTIAVSASEKPDWLILKQYQKLLDAKIVFVSTDLRAVFAPELDVKGKNSDIKLTVRQIETEKDKEICLRALNGEKFSGVQTIDFLSLSSIYAAKPLRDTENVLYGAIIVACPESSVNGIWQQIIKSMMIAALLAMIFVTAITSLLARRFTKPLSQMEQAALKIAEGDYSTRVMIEKDDEIGHLAKTLNVLSEKLEDVIEKLKDEKCKLELVLYNIGEGIVSCDEKGSIIHVNDAALGFLEISCWEAKDEAYVSDEKNRILNLLKKSMDNASQESEVFTNPSKRAIALLATPLQNAENAVIGAVCLLRDVSEEIRLEQRRRDYIANVSHELRTPLTGIRGMIEPLIDGIIETEEEKQDSYHIIDKEAARLEKMIGEMLELSRLQDGKNIPELERVELSHAVRNAIHSSRMLANRAGIDLRFEAEDEIYVISSESRISQLVVILLDNAVSFTPAGGTITVKVSRGKCRALVSVKDTGVGIEPQHLPYIWERFYKADKSRMRTTGTGLGLAIAKCIIDMLGGRITVESELGKGTEFVIRLPYYKD